MLALLSGSSNNLHFFAFFSICSSNSLNLRAKLLCQTFSLNVAEILPEDGDLKSRKIQVNITCNQSKLYFFICSWEFCRKTRFKASQAISGHSGYKQINLIFILPQSCLGSNTLCPSDLDT